MKINWKVGQEVWCILKGKGVISYFDDDGRPYPISVGMEDGSFRAYTVDGRTYENDINRSLYFSEPVIEAELQPRKPPFVPTLKQGDIIFVEDIVGRITKETVYCEEEESIQVSDGFYLKSEIKVWTAAIPLELNDAR